MPKYATYYDCSGWKSLIEVMNIEPSPRSFFIQAWDRDGSTTLQKTFNLAARETRRIDLCKEIRDYSTIEQSREGLVLIEPVLGQGSDTAEFPAVLIIAPNDPSLSYFEYNRFVPLTRIP